MNVYIVRIKYDYEGFQIDSIYASEAEADERAATLVKNSQLPSDHRDYKYAGDGVDVDCYEVKL